MTQTSPSPVARSDSLWIAEISRALLATSASSVVSGQPSPPGDWASAWQAVRRHRLEGWISQHLRTVGATEDLVERLHTPHLMGASRALRVAHDTALVSKVLTKAGIDHLVVKGAPLALVVGVSMTVRGSGDVDLWVRPADVAATEQVLAANGWSRRSDADKYPLPSDRRRWRHFLCEMIELPLSHSSATDVDLHWKLYHFATEFSFDFELALRSAVYVSIGEALVPTLMPAHALEHMAQHGRKEAWPFLRSIVDIVWLSRVIDHSEIRSISASNRNVRLAVGLASRLDPTLSDLVGLSRADARLESKAWERCLAADSRTVFRKRSSGIDGTRRLFNQLWWMWRSSPSWRVRLSQIRIWVQRSRSLIDARSRPWVDHRRLSTTTHRPLEFHNSQK